MANDDNTSEQFIREVDEEFRRDQLTALWMRYGRYVIAACVLVVAITAGLRGNDWWQAKQAAERGDAYLDAIEARQEGDSQAAGEIFTELTENGGGYGVLARFQTAAADADAGDPNAALASYDALAADTKVDANLRDLARLRAGLVALGSGDGAGATSRVESLATAGNPWRHSAREILGTVAFTQSRLEEARTLFSQVQSDAEAPANLRERANVMISLIDGMVEPAAGDTQ
ncbi:MAG: tetratricopeptide repeat protein [Alphaproteobacteria bacterium]